MIFDDNLLSHDALRVAPQEDGRVKTLVCDAQNGYKGLAYFPNDPESPKSKRIIFIDYDTLPSNSEYAVADVLAHEMGHRLGLYHTFQGGCQGDGDGVDDTNAQDSFVFTCPTNEKQLTKTCGSLDPVHNYMNYIGNDCMCSLTKGQVTRIWESLTPDLLELVQDPNGPVEPPKKKETKQTLFVRNIAAKNLNNVELLRVFGDKPDPFVELRLGSQTAQSKTIQNNLNPTWTGKRNEFEFNVINGSGILELSVYDANTIKKQIPLGTTSVVLSDLAGAEIRTPVDKHYSNPLANGGGAILEFDLRLQQRD